MKQSFLLNEYERREHCWKWFFTDLRGEPKKQIVRPKPYDSTEQEENPIDKKEMWKLCQITQMMKLEIHVYVCRCLEEHLASFPFVADLCKRLTLSFL